MKLLLAIAATALSVAAFDAAAATPLAGLGRTRAPEAASAVEQAHYYRRRYCCYRSYGYYGGGYPYRYYGYGGPVFAFSFGGGHRYRRHW